MNRFVVLFVSSALVGCGSSSASVWMREAHTLAPAPLECGRADIATLQVGQGLTYDSIGCDRVVRHTCQGRVCAPIGAVANAAEPGHLASTRRVAAIDETLALRASLAVERCGEGQPVGGTFLVSAAGEIEMVYVESTALAKCLRRAIGRLPRGSSAMMLTRVFR
ncbi:MAG: hypothetical protein ACI9KE_002833 [Polyangiales bacterium]|jgi:hypothetical protein